MHCCGADVVFVGPFDLAKSMDVEFGGDKHQAAVARVLKATKVAGKVASIFCASSHYFPARLTWRFADDRPTCARPTFRHDG